MPRLRFDVELPDQLATELSEAAIECSISPEKFAAQAIESTLASRRLDSGISGRCGPRIFSLPANERSAKGRGIATGLSLSSVVTAVLMTG